MHKLKEPYSSPASELLVIRFEEELLTISTDGNTIGDATYDEWDGEL